ncbi:hypothetical protein RND71_010509 [Anisodus tanguticus]|uniref:AAA+ ATPase domain-containing protein n=1 Tax=Anisodus tanguticus TaxID=243964 RepID=A0AAE1VS80_9SOLA|nr:hypothetical protein RND71_010509 [Anisodus tanguticus]
MGSSLLMCGVTSVISPVVIKRKAFCFISLSHYRPLMRAASNPGHLSCCNTHANDDINALFQILPCDLRDTLSCDPSQDNLIEHPRVWPSGPLSEWRTLRFHVQFPAETKTLGDFFPFVLSLVDRVTWYLLLVGGDRYPMELVDMHGNWPVILDLGCLPQAHYIDDSGRRYLRNTEVSMEEIQCVLKAIGQFGGDNRAGIEGTLHRISAIRNRKGEVIGLTCRVGRARGQIDMVRDLLDFGESILFVGRPGVGKTTVVRAISRVLSDELHKRVVIVDTSNEIGGDGDIPHPAIGGARRLQVPDPSMQHEVMIEAVENHMPEVIIVDEIGTESEVHACRTIAERGVMLIGTAHGEQLENIIKNPTLSDLIGGIVTVTLSDQEARIRNSSKSVLERKAPSPFPFLIEINERNYWVLHRNKMQTERSVDALLLGKKPLVEVL